MFTKWAKKIKDKLSHKLLRRRPSSSARSSRRAGSATGLSPVAPPQHAQPHVASALDTSPVALPQLAIQPNAISASSPLPVASPQHNIQIPAPHNPSEHELMHDPSMSASASQCSKNPKYFDKAAQRNHFYLKDPPIKNLLLETLYNQSKAGGENVVLESSNIRKTLEGCWASHQIHMATTRNEKLVRTGLDVMLSNVVKYHPRPVESKKEVDLFLPDHPHTARADAVISMALPKKWENRLQKLQNWHVFSAQRNCELDIATIPFEFKVDEASQSSKRQLSFYLVSILNQHRSLGLDLVNSDHEVYGAVVNGCNVQFYASKWHENMIVINPTTRTFDISTKDGFFGLYLFMDALTHHWSTKIEDILDYWENSGDEQLPNQVKATQNPWRKQYKPPKPT